MALDILLVDDIGAGSDLKEVLSLSLNCRVDSVYDTHAALQMAGDRNYALMIIDPFSVGYFDERKMLVVGPAACANLMTLGIPTIVLTGEYPLGREGLLQVGLREKNNYQAYFEKPTSCQEIFGAIKSLTQAA